MELSRSWELIMANYRQIHTQIWRDNWFLDLEPDEKLMFIYLFSNDSTNLAGLYEIHERVIQLETGLDKARIEEILKRFERDGKVYYQDGIVWMVNMKKYHSSAGEKVRRSIEIIVEGIPDCEVKQKYCIYNGIETENTLSEKKDTLSYSKSNSKSKLKSKSKTEEEEKSEKEEETPAGGTVPPSDFQLFAEVYELVTGSEPKVLNAEIEAVSEILKAGGTPDDFRKALQGMQDKDYTIASMASALTWTLKDVEKRKQPARPNRVGRKQTSAGLDEILDGAPIFAEDK